STSYLSLIVITTIPFLHIPSIPVNLDQPLHIIPGDYFIIFLPGTFLRYNLRRSYPAIAQHKTVVLIARGLSIINLLPLALTLTERRIYNIRAKGLKVSIKETEVSGDKSFLRTMRRLATDLIGKDRIIRFKIPQMRLVEIDGSTEFEKNQNQSKDLENKI
ncbi:hypothetical protein F5883DRAFT_548578, partial [Diaporthe sp. PMI_573]